MSRTNSQAEIIFEEQLVPRANRLVIKKNNHHVASDSHTTNTMLRFVIEILRHHKLYKPVSLTSTIPPPDPNNSYTKPPSEIQILEFIKTLEVLWEKTQAGTQLDFQYFRYYGLKDHPDHQRCLNYYTPASLSLSSTTSYKKNKSIPRRSSSKFHSSQDDQPLTKLSNTVKGDYRFGMEIPDTMISDAIKKLPGYKFYMAKKVESENVKTVDEPEEQHVSPIKSRRGKGFMCYGNQVANVPTSLKKDVVPRKIRSQTIVEEIVVGELANSISIQELHTQQRRRSQLTIDSQLDDILADTYAEWGQKLKGPAVEDPAVQSLLDLRKGSKASRLESLRQKKQAVAGEGSSAAHNKYYDSSDNDSEATLYSSSSDKTEESANETDDANESDMELSDDNPHEDNDVAGYGVFIHNKSTATPNSTYLSLTVTSSSLDFIQTLLDETPANELTYFMSHQVYTDAQTTSVVHNPKGNPELASYISCASEVPLGTHVDLTPSQSRETDAKGKKIMRKINFKKVVVQKFREYDQKLEALINFNVSKAFEKAVQAKVMTEMKKFLPTHIPKAIANYVRPRLNRYVLDLLNRIHESKSNTTHPTNKKRYDTLYESVCLDHDAFNAQDAEPSFHKRSHDNHDYPNNREEENKKKRRKDVGEPSSRSSR
ncbi:hypothetical protein Tco_1507727 [Tanacetum coccineum]